jgi:polyhydroxyalkanoate synthase
MDKPTIEPSNVGNVDVEALSRNLARLIEEGGKALAAYLKPREEGKIKDEHAEDLADAVKSLGRVAEFWLSDPARALELQTRLGRAYLDLWAGAVKRMAGEQTEPIIAIRRISGSPTPSGHRTNFLISSSRHICSRRNGVSGW